MSQIFRGIDADGDFFFGQGRSNYLRNNDAIQADIKTALQMFLGECFWSTGTGVDWWNLVGGKNPAAQAGILLQTRTVILSVDGVVQINSVSVSYSSGTRHLALQYSINTIFSRNVTGTVAPA